MDGEPQTSGVLITQRGGVLHVMFDRPQARNALTLATYEELAALLRSIETDRSVEALILTGSGGEAFAAGTDISEFERFTSDADALAYEARIERLLRALERCRVPTIAAIAGACTGGGAALAGCCDLRIGAENMRYGFPIARTLGNCLSIENLERLVALLGEPRARDLLMTARLYDAQEALSAGLVRSVVPLAVLEETAFALAQTMIALAPLTLRSTKLALARLRHAVAPAEDLLLMCYRSTDFREAVAAFKAHRKPIWEGR